MDGSKCILQVRGVRPFLSTKYDIEKHHNYKYLSDADPKKAFDIAEFVKVFKENKAKLLEGLNKKNTNHVIIKITEDEPVEAVDTPIIKTVLAGVSVSAENITTPTEQASTAIETTQNTDDTAEPPSNQNDINMDNYEDEDNEDDTDDFNPDDTELV